MKYVPDHLLFNNSKLRRLILNSVTYLARKLPVTIREMIAKFFFI